MYKIKARLGIKFHSNWMIRDERDVTKELSTASGVRRFIKEQNPFIKICIEKDGLDKTADFIDYVQIVKSRYSLGGAEYVIN
jgi:hypothetical protein